MCEGRVSCCGSGKRSEVVDNGWGVYIELTVRMGTPWKTHVRHRKGGVVLLGPRLELLYSQGTGFESCQGCLGYLYRDGGIPFDPR